MSYGMNGWNKPDGGLISRAAAIDEFDGAKVDEAYCTEYDIGYNDGIDFAVSKLSVLPSAQPDKEKISDALYNVYRNKGTSTSAEGVAAIKYYIAEIWREIFGEEGPGWMKK